MIRIHTSFSSKGDPFISSSNLSQDKWRVHTLFHNGKWITLVSGGAPIDADTLFEAGQNHLKAAYSLREKLKPVKDWQERAKLLEDF